MIHGIDTDFLVAVEIRDHPSLLAGTYHAMGIKKLITNNGTDFRGLEVFEIVTFNSPERRT